MEILNQIVASREASGKRGIYIHVFKDEWVLARGDWLGKALQGEELAWECVLCHKVEGYIEN